MHHNFYNSVRLYHCLLCNLAIDTVRACVSGTMQLTPPQACTGAVVWVSGNLTLKYNPSQAKESGKVTLEINLKRGIG